MKKFKRTLVSILLLTSTILSLTACHNKLPESDTKDGHSETCECMPHPQKGYTGGFHIMPSDYYHLEIHWVETFKEAMVAIEHLEAAGNRIDRTVISSYENEALDVKYAFLLDLTDCKHLEEGKEWYDREQCKSIRVKYIAFLEPISIKRLEREEIMYLKHIEIGRGETVFDSAEDFSYACIECNNVENEKWVIEMEDTEMCYVTRTTPVKTCITAVILYNLIDNHTEMLPENFHEDFVKTLVHIGGNYK